MKPNQPAAEFGDPEATTKLKAEAILARPSAPDYLAGLEVVTKLPEVSPLGPLLVVTFDDWDDYLPPVKATALLRLVAYAPTRDDAWSIASFFHAQFLALAGDEAVRSYRFYRGPKKGIDPQYDTPIVGFGLRARMKPQVV